MSRILSALVLVAAGFSTGCNNIISASPTPSGQTTLTFNGITADGVPVTIYSENGYSVSASGPWQGKTSYGHPAPFIEFVTPASTVGVASVQVFANDHLPFVLRSADLYSSLTPIPYTITGVRNFSVVYTASDVVSNTFGAFKTVVNTHSNDIIDTLTIQLTNPSTCCPNAIGIDNIVVSR